MASLDSLPADQRAVLQLVLQRGRTYDEIAEMLSIDRAGVRERALSALDALGPQTGVPAERRALITDYLLGQLPARRQPSTTRERLGESPSERAWARVVASELSADREPAAARDPGRVDAPRRRAAEPAAAAARAAADGGARRRAAAAPTRPAEPRGRHPTRAPDPTAPPAPKGATRGRLSGGRRSSLRRRRGAARHRGRGASSWRSS